MDRKTLKNEIMIDLNHLILSENYVVVADDKISHISLGVLIPLKEKFDFYFLKEMLNCQQNNWAVKS